MSTAVHASFRPGDPRKRMQSTRQNARFESSASSAGTSQTAGIAVSRSSNRIPEASCLPRSVQIHSRLFPFPPCRDYRTHGVRLVITQRLKRSFISHYHSQAATSAWLSPFATAAVGARARKQVAAMGTWNNNAPRFLAS